MNISNTVEDVLDPLIGMRILVVEDNELNLEIVTEVLRERGLVVTTAENGQIAVELFQNSMPGTFDVILMDMHMPVMGGVGGDEKNPFDESCRCTVNTNTGTDCKMT